MTTAVLLDEPPAAAISLTTVMQALGDDVRLQIVRALASGEEFACGTLPLRVSKATRSHHLRVLREAGLTRTRVEGTRRYVTLRRDDIDRRFPGLLDAIVPASP